MKVKHQIPNFLSRTHPYDLYRVHIVRFWPMETSMRKGLSLIVMIIKCNDRWVVHVHHSASFSRCLRNVTILCSIPLRKLWTCSQKKTPAVRKIPGFYLLGRLAWRHWIQPSLVYQMEETRILQFQLLSLLSKRKTMATSSLNTSKPSRQNQLNQHHRERHRSKLLRQFHLADTLVSKLLSNPCHPLLSACVVLPVLLVSWRARLPQLLFLHIPNFMLYRRKSAGRANTARINRSQRSKKTIELPHSNIRHWLNKGDYEVHAPGEGKIPFKKHVSCGMSTRLLTDLIIYRLEKRLVNNLRSLEFSVYISPLNQQHQVINGPAVRDTQANNHLLC